jgi:hypothetical protein
MVPKNISFISKMRGSLVYDEEFMFQPVPKRSNKGQGPIRLGPRTRESGILTSSSGREMRNLSHSSYSPTPVRDTKEEGGCPRLPRMTSPSMYVVRM